MVSSPSETTKAWGGIGSRGPNRYHVVAKEDLPSLLPFVFSTLASHRWRSLLSHQEAPSCHGPRLKPKFAVALLAVRRRPPSQAAGTSHAAVSIAAVAKGEDASCLLIPDSRVIVEELCARIIRAMRPWGWSVGPLPAWTPSVAVQPVLPAGAQVLPL